jgi:hypothetical protein
MSYSGRIAAVETHEYITQTMGAEPQIARDAEEVVRQVQCPAGSAGGGKPSTKGPSLGEKSSK